MSRDKSDLWGLATGFFVGFQSIPAEPQTPERKLTGSLTIQRINTKGGVAEGACDQVGLFLAMPYSRLRVLQKGRLNRASIDIDKEGMRRAASEGVSKGKNEKGTRLQVPVDRERTIPGTIEELRA